MLPGGSRMVCMYPRTCFLQTGVGSVLFTDTAQPLVISIR